VEGGQVKVIGYYGLSGSITVPHTPVDEVIYFPQEHLLVHCGFPVVFKSAMLTVLMLLVRCISPSASGRVTM
jgi:hypothetical protein